MTMSRMRSVRHLDGELKRSDDDSVPAGKSKAAAFEGADALQVLAKQCRSASTARALDGDT